MYTAQTLGTTGLMTADKADKQCNYVCPGCQTPVTVKKGRLKQAHFAHTSLQKCQALAEGESAVHLLGKLAMVDFFESIGGRVVLEPWLPEIQQRPDLLVTFDNRQVAIEFQCAPISVERVQRRTAGFAKLGLEVVWILGPTYQQRKLQQGTLAKFARIRHDTLQVALWRGKDGIQWREWWTVDGRLHVGRNDYADPIRQLAKIQQQLVRRDRRIRQLQKQLYQQERTVTGIPVCCHISKPLPGGLKTTHWMLATQLIGMLEQEPCHTDQLLTMVERAEWFVFGATSDSAVAKLWLTQLLALWQSMEVVQFTNDRWHLVTNVQWFADFNQKLRELRSHVHTVGSK